MNTFTTHLPVIFSPARTRNSRATHLNKMLPALRCGLVMLSMLAGAGVIQAQQQPDPLTITNTGNVGIGMVPNNKLSVNGNADVSGKLSVAGNADVSGNVGIGTTPSANKLSVAGNSNFSGSVGIGLQIPGEKLHVNGAIRVDDASLKFFSGGNLKSFIGPSRNNDFSLVAKENDKWLRLGANGGIALWANGSAETSDAPQFLLRSDGNVGIGTTNPTKAKLEINGSASNDLGRYGYLSPSGTTGTYTAGRLPYSLWASNAVAAPEFQTYSDARIKNIQGRSDSATDLRTLLSLEVTNYRYKDVIGNGNGTYKKVTGQQVEKVFPQAVSKQTQVVPDIYQPASIQDGWIALSTDLKKGERVRLISEKAAGVYEVLEVAQNKFRTDLKPEGDRIFVYGREVSDFLAVDYEAISMLNVSATQQIKKEKDEEVKALQEENAALRSQLTQQEQRLSELEARDKARDEKLAAIEAMLLSGNPPAARDLSLKKAN